MTIRLTWPEVKELIVKHTTLPGVQLGDPRIYISTPYGPESSYQDGDVSIEFPISFDDSVAVAPAAQPAEVPLPEPISDDVPF